MLQRPFVNAIDHGAKGNGKTDDTAAVQAALHAAGKASGICFLPAGIYRLDGPLTVPPSVTLKGSYEHSPHPKHPIGTVLNLYSGRGNEDAPAALTLQWNASVRNLLINYPEQEGPPSVVPYPWTIVIDGETCEVVDVTIVNPYKAIDAGTNVNERHLLRNIYASPLHIGVFIDRCYDIGRLENVHFNPNVWMRSGLNKLEPPAAYTGEPHSYFKEVLFPFLKTHLIGFKIGRTDWEYISNSFVIVAKEGFVFDDYGHGAGNALITQSGSDIGPVGMQVNKTTPHAGIQMTNCQFMSTIKIGPENEGTVKVSSSGFWVVPETDEQIVKEGPSTLIVNGCHFHNWDMSQKGVPCIRATGGRMILSNSEFMQKEKANLMIEGDFISGTVSGCLFRNNKVTNASGGHLEMTGNCFE